MKCLQCQRPSHSENDDRGMSQQGQLTELLDGKEPRDWISEAEWAIYIKEEPDVYRRSPSVVSIFRVPTVLKESNKEAYYVPKIVSLGPYHHKSEELAPMDRQKGKALRRMMARFDIKQVNDPNNLIFPDRARKEIEMLDNKIRNSYEEKISCNKETLAMMLTLDGCFILEILRTLGGDTELDEETECYEPIFGRNKINYTGNDILNDILKLENQIPWIVLQKLLKLEFDTADNVEPEKFLAFLVKVQLSRFYPFKDEWTKWCWPQPDEQRVHHLLGLLHSFIVSSPRHRDDEDQVEPLINCYSTGCPTRCSIRHQQKNKDKAGNGGTGHPTKESRNPGVKFTCSSAWCRMPLKRKNKAVNGITSPRAVELRNAGINFKPCDGGIMEIKFDRNSATVFLPSITISDYTEVLFRNLIAFEMCKPSQINYVASYVSLMDDLIDSDQDVALLRRMGIVTNLLGSDAEVAELFNGLCRGVTVDSDAFQNLAGRVNVHYSSKIKIQLAKLAREHFSSPWKFLGLVGAIVLLLLTAVQTIFSILSVYNR